MAEEFRLFLLTRQTMQHRAATLRRQRIIIERRPRFAEPAQPALPLGAELGFELFAKSLSQGATVAGGGNGDLQWTTADHGGIVEITKGTVTDNIAEDPALLCQFKHGPVQCLDRCGDDHKKQAIQVARLEATLFPDNLVLRRPASNGSSSGRSDHDHTGSASQECGYLFFGCFPSTHHKAAALCKLDEHREERDFLSRQS